MHRTDRSVFYAYVNTTTPTGIGILRLGSASGMTPTDEFSFATTDPAGNILSVLEQ